MTNNVYQIGATVTIIMVALAWTCYTIKNLFDCGIDLIDAQEKTTKKTLANAVESVLVSAGCLAVMCVLTKLAYMIIAIGLM